MCRFHELPGQSQLALFAPPNGSRLVWKLWEEHNVCSGSVLPQGGPASHPLGKLHLCCEEDLQQHFSGEMSSDFTSEVHLPARSQDIAVIHIGDVQVITFKI